jgi:hypothetical protein
MPTRALYLIPMKGEETKDEARANFSSVLDRTSEWIKPVSRCVQLASMRLVPQVSNCALLTRHSQRRSDKPPSAGF